MHAPHFRDYGNVQKLIRIYYPHTVPLYKIQDPLSTRLKSLQIDFSTRDQLSSVEVFSRRLQIEGSVPVPMFKGLGLNYCVFLGHSQIPSTIV